MNTEVFVIDKVRHDDCEVVTEQHRLYVGRSHFEKSGWTEPRDGYRCTKHIVYHDGSFETVRLYG